MVRHFWYFVCRNAVRPTANVEMLPHAAGLCHLLPVPVKLGEVKHSKGFLEEETKIFLVENNRKVFGRRKNSN